MSRILKQIDYFKQPPEVTLTRKSRRRGKQLLNEEESGIDFGSVWGGITTIIIFSLLFAHTLTQLINM